MDVYLVFAVLVIAVYFAFELDSVRGYYVRFIGHLQDVNRRLDDES